MYKSTKKGSQTTKIAIMQNDEGKIVDLYIPRKCTATNRLLISSDHSAVQINIGKVDKNGVYTGEYVTAAFSGFVRKNSESDQAMNRFAADAGLIRDLQSFPGSDKFKDNN